MLAGWGTWIASWGWGAVLICITVACQVTGVVLIQRWVDITSAGRAKGRLSEDHPGYDRAYRSRGPLPGDSLRDRVVDLGRRLRLAWRGSNFSRRSALFRQFDDDARRFGALSRAAVASDGGAESAAAWPSV